MPAEKSTVQAHLPSKEELKEEVAEATKSSLQSLRALVAGGVGGVCAVVVGHPFDLVKVRLQTAEKGVYSGAMDVVRRTIAREGLARVSGLVFLALLLGMCRGVVRWCRCLVLLRMMLCSTVGTCSWPAAESTANEHLSSAGSLCRCLCALGGRHAHVCVFPFSTARPESN